MTGLVEGHHAVGLLSVSHSFCLFSMFVRSTKREANVQTLLVSFSCLRAWRLLFAFNWLFRDSSEFFIWPLILSLPHADAALHRVCKKTNRNTGVKNKSFAVCLIKWESAPKMEFLVWRWNWRPTSQFVQWNFRTRSKNHDAKICIHVPCFPGWGGPTFCSLAILLLFSDYFWCFRHECQEKKSAVGHTPIFSVFNDKLNLLLQLQLQ